MKIDLSKTPWTTAASSAASRAACRASGCAAWGKAGGAGLGRRKNRLAETRAIPTSQPENEARSGCVCVRKAGRASARTILAAMR
jgi:hypothetical protein